MDLGDVGKRVKASLALDRQIKFVEAAPGISDEKRAAIVAALRGEQRALLEGAGVQGGLPLQDPAGDGAKASRGGGKAS